MLTFLNSKIIHQSFRTWKPYDLFKSQHLKNVLGVKQEKKRKRNPKALYFKYVMEDYDF